MLRGSTAPPFLLGVEMPERIRIAEIHRFSGQIPAVDTWDHVDTAMLYEGDSAPFHLTLKIAEEERVSANGLLYDKELVDVIETQLKEGTGGIRGHIREGDEDSAYPYDEVNWIGTIREGKSLWAKGYIPPGKNREDIRRKKAVGGRVGTSIYGNAVREMVVTETGRRVWRAKKFELESLDLAPAKRASLRVGGEFAITREMQMRSESEDQMDPIQITSLSDVPQSLREQIAREAIRQADLEGKAQRLAELEQEVPELRQQVAEAATYKTLVTEIRATIGKDTDTLAVITEYHTQITKLAEMLGVPFTNIVVKVEEFHEQIAEIKRGAFSGQVGQVIAELTKPMDGVTKDEHKTKRDKFRANFQNRVVTEMAAVDDAERTPERIKETATKLWDEEYSLFSEALVREFAGPNALIPPSTTNTIASTGGPTDAELAARGQRFVPKH